MSHDIRSPKSAMIEVIVLVACTLVLFLSGCPRRPEGGGCTQTAPDSVKVGEPAVIGLELTIWGSTRGIQGRYTGVAVSYRLVGGSEYSSVTPQLLSQEKEREFYQIIIPAYPQGVQGEIEYFINLKLDGQPSRINGIKKIKIEPI